MLRIFREYEVVEIGRQDVGHSMGDLDQILVIFAGSSRSSLTAILLSSMTSRLLMSCRISPISILFQIAIDMLFLPRLKRARVAHTVHGLIWDKESAIFMANRFQGREVSVDVRDAAESGTGNGFADD